MEKSLLRNLLAIIRQYRMRLLRGALFLLVSNGLLILNPLIMRQAILALDPAEKNSINAFSQRVNAFLGPYAHSLFFWITLLLGIAFISSYFKYQMRVVFMTVSRDAEYQMRLKLFERMQRQSQAFYDRHGVGELLSRLTNDISAYRDVLGPGLIYPLFFLTMVVPALIALFSISLSLAAVALIPLFSIPFLNAFLRRRIYESSHRIQQALGVMSNMVQEYFSGIRVVKSYVIESVIFHRFCELCLSFRKESIQLSCLQSLLFPILNMLTKIVTILLVSLAGFLILVSEKKLSSADFISFMWIQSYLFFPLLMLAWILPIYERGRAAYERLIEVVNDPLEIQEGRQPHLKIASHAAIHLRHLTFSYPHALTPALAELNLNINSGEFIGITGPIGAGKSTLFRLINREYEVPTGMIYIGEQEIHEYTLESFSQAIVSVEQVPFLFSKSIADNVRLGKEGATQQEFEAVLELAGLSQTISELPEKGETMVGEKGVKLSGGQKQRLAMARAFLVNRQILLLDDIFSALDSVTEKRIFDAIKEKFAHQTVLLITHRLSVLERLDRIVYMSEGKIVEDGHPQDLKQKKGYYAALIELQNKKETHGL